MKKLIFLTGLILMSCGENNAQSSDSSNEKTDLNKIESKTIYNLPEDVTTRIINEYSDKDNQEFIINSLIKLGIDWKFEGARVARCILFLSQGNFESFKENLKRASEDWRDVIMYAEYDENNNQTYDFKKTFEQNGL